MIAIVDYEIGNLYSIFKALERLGEEVVVTNQAQEIREAEAVVLPGVGSFEKAMENLEKKEIKEVIKENQEDGKPFLGINLGLQLLFEKSQEAPRKKGLSLLPGEVVKLPPTNKIPHMGWNRVYFKKNSPLTRDIPQGRFFYFAHSFYVLPEEPQAVVGICNYNVVIPAIVNHDNVWGFQFHPEKSSVWGMKVLENWVRSWKK
ncbi:imidazole glycerol phosphate synthase subunit HisH [Candidatus Sordicultor fermentans]|jgi:glutamine amidotransferase|uniref:imidazole glycerol phosphate synthase subunit HisH n=1 Tax=Candidatus Sordicultor fermentans TaxID=1953203 RepID=UPI0016A811DE|nr:imidazole glycerol phosphate synthase subunit HisH [Atribacterota bacterium]NLY05339.1 imidazole glycerol phosphate synthase subunit HisH [Candidatus Atribacteria bacterium]MDI9608225.1 imidazole glycerol phosphate synthase subunit HisH [Atribacterota bacterium]HOA98347.1 imidazole glycerol phosphate synthase subunit HisH [Candidatus Atribacteria bacterium]HOQ50614.1 imidazole glycerol phosphate synthase subunit HisH [Candidatus Atribacteria bacterium]